MKLTRSEVETIFIHMNAFKEKLLNQGRLNEAWKYQDIVDKLDGLLTAESVIRCKDCMHNRDGICGWHYGVSPVDGYRWVVDDDDFCSCGERAE